MERTGGGRNFSNRYFTDTAHTQVRYPFTLSGQVLHTFRSDTPTHSGQVLHTFR
jgi:hypothetical protein